MCPRHCRCPQHQEHAPNPINTSAGSGAPRAQEPTGCGCPWLAAGPQVIRSFICRKRTQQLRCGRANAPAAALIKTQDRTAPENRDLAELSRSTGHRLNIYPSAQRSTLCMEGCVGNRRAQAPPSWHSQLPMPPRSAPSVPALARMPGPGAQWHVPPPRLVPGFGGELLGVNSHSQRSRVRLAAARRPPLVLFHGLAIGTADARFKHAVQQQPRLRGGLRD